MLHNILFHVILMVLILKLHHFLPAPVRFYLRIILYYFCILLLCLIMPFVLVLRPFRPENHALVFHVFRWLTSWVPIEFEVRGREHLEKVRGGAVIICNHQSSLDLLAMSLIWPDNCVSLAKRSLMYTGPVGLTFWLCSCVFIDRFDRRSAVSTMKTASMFIKDNQLCIFIFPEGTRHRDQNHLKSFKKGAFHVAVDAGLPLLPVVISSYKPFYSLTERRWNDDGRAIVEILPPIHPTFVKKDQNDEADNKNNNENVAKNHEGVTEYNENITKVHVNVDDHQKIADIEKTMTKAYEQMDGTFGRLSSEAAK